MSSPCHIPLATNLGVPTVSLRDWFSFMAIKYCGRDYGSPRRNQYFLYRTVYGMSATEAWRAVHTPKLIGELQ